jgi:hypothetical protein
MRQSLAGSVGQAIHTGQARGLGHPLDHLPAAMAPASCAAHRDENSPVHEPAALGQTPPKATVTAAPPATSRAASVLSPSKRMHTSKHWPASNSDRATASQRLRLRSLARSRDPQLRLQPGALQGAALQPRNWNVQDPDPSVLEQKEIDLA